MKRAIERAVDGTDPWIRAVSGYQKKLRPSVLHAIDHVYSLADGMTPAIVFDPALYDTNPLLRTLFMSAGEMQRFLESDETLAEFRREHGRVKDASSLHGMLVVEKQEKNAFGVERSGNVIMRDVAQVTVSFEGHRLVDLSFKEEERSRLLRRRAYDHLLKLALGRLTAVKTRRGRLEKHRTLLRSKLDLLQREGWGFDDSPRGKHHDVAAIEEDLQRIEKEILDVGGDDKMLEAYLGIVADVLGNAESHFWRKKETLIVDRMGIKRGVAASDAPEIPLDMLYNIEGRSLAVSLVTLPMEVVKGR
ncbi:hypothetical protein LPW11_20200 [Geomonas sp. RF6]|uniref:hypothetical protein n=1 Tax=Geomonas sp. RF6 TaxID=2897342 RepID=UPI001E2F9FE2|nr:hypothetical protein [Geomonas sp. RF6]UFS70183.1 hypothetical protein LPW11_20200 [Geomonas sp. RF6]